MGYQVICMGGSMYGALSPLERIKETLQGRAYRDDPTVAKIPAVAKAVEGKLPENFMLLGDKDRRVGKIFGVAFDKEDNVCDWYCVRCTTG